MNQINTDTKPIILFAPLRTDLNHLTPSNRATKVLAIEIQAAQPWSVYRSYEYISALGTKPNAIQRHRWASERSEPLLRAPRVIHFADVTGCRPIDSPLDIRTLRSHHAIETLAYCDHTSYWYGPSGEPLSLTEPYTPGLLDTQAEIKRRGLTAVILPTPGLYAGGGNWTISVLMGLPQHQPLLDEIALKLDTNSWPTPEVVEMDWATAMELSNGGVGEVSHDL